MQKIDGTPQKKRYKTNNMTHFFPCRLVFGRAEISEVFFFLPQENSETNDLFGRHL